MTMRREQLYTKRVDRSKKRAPKCFDRFERQSGFENALPCALLHFISGAVCISDDHELRQPFRRALSILCDRNDSIGDRARFAGAGGSDHRKVEIQFTGEAPTRLLIGDRGHFDSSSASSEKAGWVRIHFVFSRSGSIGSVASGYFLTNPKSLWTGPSIPKMPVSCIRCSSRQKSFCARTSDNSNCFSSSPAGESNVS